VVRSAINSCWVRPNTPGPSFIKALPICTALALQLSAACASLPFHTAYRNEVERPAERWHQGRHLRCIAHQQFDPLAPQPFDSLAHRAVGEHGKFHGQGRADSGMNGMRHFIHSGKVA
jgi:hypothetical protein